MPKININREKCKGCLLCISFCPKGAIIPDKKLNRKGLKPVIFKNIAGCSGCCLCALICPECCIEVWR